MTAQAASTSLLGMARSCAPVSCSGLGRREEVQHITDMWRRRGILACALFPVTVQAQRLAPTTPDTAEGAALVAALRGGGHVLFFRHADTRGEPCDRSFRVGDRAGQRNISAAGRAQAVRIGARLAELAVPVALPVLAGPVYRARDTAEAAFGPDRVRVTDSLLADDFAGDRIGWVLAEHRRLFSAPVAPGANRVLVGHRTPAIMVAGDAVAGRAFPEGAGLVIAPDGAGGFGLAGILELAPLPGGGFHGCG
jgi:phosphohistidine phosphatase SixA